MVVAGSKGERRKQKRFVHDDLVWCKLSLLPNYVDQWSSPSRQNARQRLQEDNDSVGTR